MANKNFDQGYCIGKRLIEIAGSFIPLTGAGTVVASSVRGFGFGYAPNSAGVTVLQPNATGKVQLTTTPGILRTGTGLYTLTLEDPYADCNLFSVDLAAPVAGSQLWAQPVEPIANLGSATAAPVFSILIINNAGTPTDAAANMRMYFALQMRDSTVQKVKP
jgi:hypothetical protein